MIWARQWAPLSKKIAEFSELESRFTASTAAFGSDYHGTSNSTLIPLGRNLFSEVMSLKKINHLPSEIMSSLSKLEKTVSNSSFSGIPGLSALSLMLTSFKIEMDGLLFNPEDRSVRRAELSFLHLQRLIVADESVRRQWCVAFKDGETSVERLGAVHLLSHGIFAFKIHGIGERTDLILNEPLESTMDDVDRTGSILTLTEWKLARDEGEIEDQIQQAKKQAQRYSIGVLGNTEIYKTRYLVIVNKKKIDFTKSVEESDVRYRIIVLAVEPELPSAKG